MITLPNGNLLVETPADLPRLAGAKRLYLDVETRSGDTKRGGDRPFKGDRICGISVTVDDLPQAFYIPIRHNGIWAMRRNLDIGPVQMWLADTLKNNEEWVNHNVKFDAHFCAQDGAIFGGRLVDTLTLAKLHYSDSMSYGLKYLAKNWLGIQTDEADEVKAYLKGVKSKDFADVPPDLLGKYACADVQMNRKLYEYLLKERAEQIKGVWETEVLLTPVLFDMERQGMPIVPDELAVESVVTMRKLIAQAEEMQTLLKREFNPKSPADVYDLLINQFGLPVLAFKKNRNPDGTFTVGNPTFDKSALKLYKAHPEVLKDPIKKRILDIITTYRQDYQYWSLFVEPYRELHADSILHPIYNQCVRTGRMSCRQPNAQQLNKRAKMLIHALNGYGILSYDYSQIEFRLIVHYINNRDAIDAYNRDPETDFHQFIADQIGIDRKPAKNLNFAMGYGAGKNKVLTMLRTDEFLISQIQKAVNKDDAAEFIKRVEALAIKTYADYHDRLPELKPTSYRASDTAKLRGYVFNAHGRRRHLQVKFSYRAFNSVIQPEAADVMKERLVAIAPRYNKQMRDWGVLPFLNVHDEVGFQAPVEAGRDPTVRRYIKDVLENTNVKYRVPIITEGGWSETNWYEASADENRKYEQYTAGPIDFDDSDETYDDAHEDSGVGLD